MEQTQRVEIQCGYLKGDETLRGTTPGRDLVVYRDKYDGKEYHSSWEKVAIIVEPATFSSHLRNLLLSDPEHWKSKFDRILTHDPIVLKAFDGKAEVANLNAVTWLTKQEWESSASIPKEWSVSHLCGGKTEGEGHRIRQWLWSEQGNLLTEMTSFASPSSPRLRFYLSGNFSGGLANPLSNPSSGPSKVCLFNSMFHVCIEAAVNFTTLRKSCSTVSYARRYPFTGVAKTLTNILTFVDSLSLTAGRN